MGRVIIEQIAQDTIRIEPPYLVIKPQISEEEYFRITNEDSNCELFEGEIIMNTPASISHEDLFMFLSTIMRSYADIKDLGKVIGSRYPMRLEKGTLPEPEIIFVRKDRLHLFKKKYLDGPADLVVEILSESTYNFDLKRKREKYRIHRIKEIWFIDPIKRRIIVDYLEDDKYNTIERSKGRIESKVLDGFYIEAEWLLKKRLPKSYEILQKIIK